MGQKIKELRHGALNASLFKNSGKSVVVSFQKLFLDAKNNNKPTYKTIYLNKNEVVLAIELLSQMDEVIKKNDTI